MQAHAWAGSTYRSSTSSAARLRQNTPMAPATPAAMVKARRVDASVAASLIARPAAEAAASLRMGPIKDITPEESLRAACAGFLVAGALGPTTKQPRDEADADHGGQGRERPFLDRLDQAVGRGIAHFRRILERGIRHFLGAFGLFLEEGGGGL